MKSWRSVAAEQLHRFASSSSSAGIVVFVAFVLTVIAVGYKPPDLQLEPANAVANMFSMLRNSTFQRDDSVLVTAEDAAPPLGAAADEQPVLITLEPNVTLGSVTLPLVSGACDPGRTKINCSDPGVLVAIETANKRKFPDMRRFEYGMPVKGSRDSKCDVEWSFKPRSEKSARMYRDYREYTLLVNSSCDYVVEKIGKWHSGTNARKQDTVNDTNLTGRPLNTFWNRKYLYYTRGGDYCKSMSQYMWSFLCALGEARYLNRTFVVDLDVCFSATSPGHQGGEGKDFRLYFDYDHLREQASVVELKRFLRRWDNWNRKHPQHKLSFKTVEDLSIPPRQLLGEESTILMRSFKRPEPNNYWYRVCEGETEKVIQRPWDLLWKSKRLMNIVNSICGKMEWDFDALHVVRGSKAENRERWPNLDKDTRPEALLEKLEKLKVEEGRRLYIASNEQVEGYFDKLRPKYAVFLLNDFNSLWAPGSEWYNETLQLKTSMPEFDGFMKAAVDSEVVFRAKKRVETFGELTSDCKNGVGTC